MTIKFSPLAAALALAFALPSYAAEAPEIGKLQVTATREAEAVDDVPASVKKARRDRLMRLQKQIVQRKQKARRGEVVRVMVDGPSPDSPLVLQGRLEGQAPDIDSVVYLSECDASAIAAGRVVDARITGGRDYDLVAAVVGDPEGRLLYC